MSTRDDTPVRTGRTGVRRRGVAVAVVLAGAAGVAAGAVLTLGGGSGGTAQRRALPAFLGAAIGAPRADAPAVRRPAPGVAVTLKPAGGYAVAAPAQRAAALPAGRRTASVSIESTAPARSAWQQHATGATRSTTYGHETVTVTPRTVEQFLTVAARTGQKTWEWKLDSSLGWPRVGDDGYVAFIDAKRQIRQDLLIAPVRILDGRGRSITPKGLRWQVAQNAQGSWFLQLPLDDAKLPLPYVIDPATLRGTQTSGGMSGQSSFTIAVPAGLSTADLMVASIFAKGNGANVTGIAISSPDGAWTADKAFTNTGSSNKNGGILYSKKYTGGSTAFTVTPTWASGTTGDAAGVVSAFAGWYAKDVVSSGQPSWSGTGTARTISSIGTSCLGTVGGVNCTITPSGSLGFTNAYQVFTAGTEQILVYRDTVYTVKARGVNGTTAVAHANGEALSLVSSLGSGGTITPTSANDLVVQYWASDTKASSGNQFGLSAGQLGTATGATTTLFGGTTGGTTAVDVAFWTQPTASATTVFYVPPGSGMATSGFPLAFRVAYTPDLTAPAAAIGVPTTATRNATSYSSAWSGTSSDPDLAPGLAGSGVGSVALRIQRSTDSFYWTGSAWQAGTATIAATGTTSWNATGPDAGSLTSGATYTVTPVATDTAGNSADGTPVSFLYDAGVPTSSVTVPAASAHLDAAGYTTSWSGGASDTGGSGLTGVALRIQRSSDSFFWSGSAWQLASTTIAASGTGSWTATGPTSGDLSNGETYTVTPIATDAAGNSQDGTPSTFSYDTSAPTVTGVASATPNGTKKLGDTIAITVDFSESVTVTGTPKLTLETGSTDQAVSYTGGNGTATLTFTYTVQNGDTSTDLDYTSTGALALNSGTITDAAGNNATLTLATPGTAGSLGNANALVIDGVVPTVTGVSSQTADGTFVENATIDVSVSFDAVVTVTGAPVIALETGSVDREAAYTSGSGTATLHFTYTVQSGDTSPDLDYRSTGALTLPTGSIRDAAGNDAELALPTPGGAGSLAAAKALVVDGAAPTVTSVGSATANGTKKLGDTVLIDVAFSESVDVTGVPRLTLETGSVDQAADYVSGSGSATLTFSYTVLAGDTAADLDYKSTTALALNGGTVQDAAGNAAILTLATPGATGSLGSANAFAVDGIVPTVTGVAGSSPNGTYRTGQQVDVTVTFSEAVTAIGIPQLTLDTGSGTRTAAYLSGSPGTTLTFRYTVQATDTSSDLDYASTGALAVNGGTLRDSAGNDAALTLPVPGATGSLGANASIAVDGVAPTVTSVTSTTPDATYGNGDTIDISVVFSEPVTVTGAPSVLVDDGAAGTAAPYATGTGTTTLHFAYTVGTSDANPDLDVIDTASLALDGGTIKDAAGNSATLTLPAPGGPGSLSAGKAIAVQASVTPAITGVSSVESNGTFKAGDTIDVQVTFSLPVTVTGSPQLLLETGTTDHVAAYQTGSPGTTLVFRYTVAQGDTSGDLNYATTGALDLNGGTIKNGGTDADLTLPAPGAGTSLGGARNLLVDGVLPVAGSVSASTPSGSYRAGDTVTVTVGFSEPVVVGGLPRIAMAAGATPRYATYAGGSGGATLSFDYLVVAGDTSADLDYTAAGALGLNGGTIADAAGNAAALTLAAPGAAGSLGSARDIVIDTTAPAVPVAQAQVPAGGIGLNGADVAVVAADATFELASGGTDTNAVTVSYAACPGSCASYGAAVLSAAGVIGSSSSLLSAYPVAWTPLPADGAFTVFARATDAAGNTSDSAALQVLLDTAAPTVSTPTLSALPAAPSGAFQSGSTIYFRSSAPGSFTLEQAIDDGSGSGSQQVTFPAIATSGWTHGAETVNGCSGEPCSLSSGSTFTWTGGASTPIPYATTGYDNAGNTAASGSLSFTSDTTAPTTPSVATPGVGGSGAIVDGSTLKLSAAPTDAGAGIADVAYKACAGASCTFASATITLGSSTDAAGKFPVTWPAGRADGTYTIVARATDNVGNTADSAGITVILDNTAPAITGVAVTSVSPQENGQPTALVSGTSIVYKGALGSGSGSFRVEVTGSDAGSGLQQAQFPALAGSAGGWTHTAQTITSAGPVYTASNAYTWPAGETAAPTLTVTLKDAAGNTASSTLTLADDSAAPTTTWTPSNRAALAAWQGSDASVELTAADTGAAGVAAIHHEIDATATTASPTGGTFSIAAEGSHTITFLAVDAVGNAETVQSPVDLIRIDKTVPVNVPALAGSPSGVVLSGTTLWYRATGGGSGGSFGLANAVTDTGSGAASSTFGAIAGTATGWTSPADHTVTGASPYASQNYSWAEGATTSGATIAVQSADAAGNVSTTATLTLADDSAGPTGGSVDYAGGLATSTTPSVAYTLGSDGGAGVASAVLERATATLTGSSCGSFGSFSAVATGLVSSGTFSDSGLAAGACYTWRLVVSDRLGNTAAFTSAAEYKLDSTSPLRAVGDGPANGHLLDNAGTLWVSPNGGSFQLKLSDAAQSGVTAVSYPAVSVGGVTPTLAGAAATPSTAPFTSAAYTWTSAFTGPSTITVAISAGGSPASEPLVVRRDATAPVTGDDAPAGAQSSAVTVSLSPSDGESGVAATYFTTDGSTPAFDAATGAPTGSTQQGTSVSLATSGSHTLKFLSRDSVGNVEAVQTKTVLVDLADDRPANAVAITPGSVSPAGAAGVSSGIVWVNAGAGGSLQLRNHVTDGVSGPASSSTGAVSGASTAGWSHAGGAMGDAGSGDYDSSAVTWSAGAASPVTIAVSSTDNVGNTSTTTTVTLQTDATAPSLTLTPPSSPRSTAGTVLVSVSDAGSGIRGTYYTVDGSTPGAAADGTPTGTSALVGGGSIAVPATEGTLVVKAIAVDNVGNASAEATATVVVDLTAPDAPVLAAVASPSHTGATLQLTGAVADTGGAGGVAVAYYVCSGSSAACGSPTLVGSVSGSAPYAVTWSSQPADGTYTVFARATDAAGNAADSTGQTIAVDNNAPIMSIASGPSGPTSSTSATFDFTASEDVTFECDLDGAGYATCTDPVTFTVASGAHTFVVRARDSANNLSTPVTYPTWTVDTVAPSGSFAPTAPPAGSTWSLTATATDAGGTGMLDVTFQYAPSVSGAPGTWTTIGSAVAAPGPYAASWATGPSNGIPNGDYFLQAVARDVATNSASLTAPVAVTVANTPKALLTASVGTAGTQLALQYNGQIDTGSVPSTGSFTVHVGTTTVAVSGVSFGFDTVYLALASAVLSGDTVTVDYAPQPLSATLKDVLGFDLATLSGQGVGNSSTVGATPPRLVSGTPADGTTLPATGLASGTISFTADKTVAWTGVQLEVPAGAPAAPAFTAPAGLTASATYASTAPGLYTFRATLDDGVNAPVNVASHFTIAAPAGAVDPPSTSESADPAAGGTLPSSDGGATVEWEAGTFAEPTTITVDPVISSTSSSGSLPPVVFGLSTSVTTSAVEVVARRLADGAEITSFPEATPLELVFDGATAEDVPIRSSDGGITYQDIPRIPGPGLPPGFADGYWFDSGTTRLHILTTHLTVFAVVRDTSPPSAPRSLSGVISGDGITLRWEPASDNSGRIARYHLYVNGERVQTFGGTTFEAKLGPYTPGDTRVFQVRADDSRGNVGQPANAVTLLPAIAGQTPAAARGTLVRSGLSIGPTTTVSSTQPQGTIVATVPAYPAVVTVGGTIGVTVSDGAGLAAGTGLVLKVASAKHVALRQRKSVALRVLVSVPAKATITMRNSKGATVASWKKTLRAGATIVNVKIPAVALRSGTYRFTVAAEPQQASSAKPTLRTTSVQFAPLPAPVGKAYDVVLVNGPATRQAVSLVVPGAATVRTVTAAPDVYDVAASAKTNVQAVVIDLDTKGIDVFHFVRNLRAVYPDLRIVALASTPAQVDQARLFGATVVLTKPLSVEVLASVLRDLLPVATSATRATATARPTSGLGTGAQSVAAQAATAKKK